MSAPANTRNIDQLRPLIGNIHAAGEGRVFLNKPQATAVLGLACSSQVERGAVTPPAEAEVILALRLKSGRVVEAGPGQVLHAQIFTALGGAVCDGYEDGWTVKESWLITTIPAGGVQS